MFQNGDVIKETINANITDDTITVELQLPDSTLITQHIDFTRVGIYNSYCKLGTYL